MHNLHLRGVLRLVSTNPDGSIEFDVEYENLITNIGYDHLVRTIGGDRNGINRIGLGVGTAPASIFDTKLYDKVITVVPNKDYSIEKRINFQGIVRENTFSSTVGYTEGGLIYRNSQGEETLISRLVFPSPIYQKSTNPLTLTYSIILN